jgi:UDP-GlcNAc:undecaprenyl-phosphate GlcNAc-1-phosphate transferase
VLIFLDKKMLRLVLPPTVVSFLITLIFTPLTIKLAKTYGLVDDPKKRQHPAHVHKGIIPRAGGLPVYLAIFISAFLFLPTTKKLIGVFLGASVAVIVGLLDDKYDLNPYLRLISNIGAALLVVSSGVGVPYITNPFGGILHLDQPRIYFNFYGPHSIWILSSVFALFWIVWTMNMVNWSKGVPGQMPGVTTVAALTIGALSYRFAKTDPTQIPAMTLSFITAASHLGFLFFNFDPQKIMPGYGGGSLAGFMLAVLSILSFSKVATGLLVLGVPTIDALFTILRRLASGRSPVWPDKDHLHHKLLDLGWTFKKIALFYWLVCAILGLVALNLNSKGKLFVLILVAIIAFGGLLWLRSLTTLRARQGPTSGSKI